MPERQRKIFVPGLIDDLAESIANNGLIHPIVIHVEEGEYALVAGERRLRAITKLHETGVQISHDGAVVPLDEVPYVELQDLDQIKVKEIELDENLLREDLTWQEKNEAIAELHRLREAQNPTQTATETAREIKEKTGVSRTTAERSVQRALLIEQFADDPEVSRAKTESAAFKIASKKVEEEFILATEQPRRGRGDYACIQGDCAEVMQTLKANHFSCIIGDPPYGMDADKFGDNAARIHAYEDSDENAMRIADAILQHGLRITTPTAHLFMFCDIELFARLRRVAEERGWIPWRTPIVWAKGSTGFAPDQSHGLRRSYELIFMARKGDHRVKKVISDVINIPPVPDKRHAAQKPVDLYRALLDLGTYPGQYALDPCCGAGTIFEAAKSLDVRALGIEQDQRFFELSQSIAMGT